MSKGYKRWEKLDNTAHVFPVIAGETMTNTYRIAVVLTEDVDGDLLQEALDATLPRFPGFKLRMRNGVFWYYLEENDKRAPLVVEETEYPCRFIHPNRNHSYLFRVTYYRRRINLEVFHVLTDGMGGIGFLRELTYEYLRRRHPALGDQMGDGLSVDTSLDREDSFLRNYRKASRSMYESKRAFLIKGDKLPYHGFGVVHGHMPVSELKKASRELHGCSINEYLVAAFIYGIYKSHTGHITKKRPVRIAVPVNLRPFFDSMTTKNFFVMISAEFIPEKSDYSFDEICHMVHDCLRGQLNRENLEQIFSYNVSNEQTFIARAVPLVIKNLAIKLVYTRAALASTSTMTNVGNVTISPEYEPYIESFHCFLSFSKGQDLKAAIISYKDDLVLTFSSALYDTAIQKSTFSAIASDGVDVRIETNGVYYE